jgi:hypothetical protein
MVREMKRHSLPPRKTPLRKFRARPRRGQPTKEEKGDIRADEYARSGGLCELNLSPKHISSVLPPTGDIYERWHLVHLKGKRVHGWGPNNLCGGCYWCHIDWLHQGGKPCPKK